MYTLSRGIVVNLSDLASVGFCDTIALHLGVGVYDVFIDFIHVTGMLVLLSICFTGVCALF